MPPEPESAHVRMSDADREKVINQLQAAVGEGRLNLDEFTERIDALYAARTFGELVPITGDLPSVAAAVPEAQDELTPSSSNLKRVGRWMVPRRLSVRPKGSNVKLDFTDAVLPHREVDIELGASASSVTLVVPRNADVDEQLTLKASTASNRVPFTGTGSVLFRVRGTVWASAITMRHRRRFLWWVY